MRLPFFLLIIALTLISCKKEITADEGDIAFIGGEIINPVDNKVILSKSEKIIDTILLDDNNRFLYKIKHLESGLYSFRLQAYHGVEFQLALLEPNDSIMIRLNTMDFDESLVFTGKGAKKNNYLIDMFLKNEEDEKKILRYSQLSPEIFAKRLDSIRNDRSMHLVQFNGRHKSTELFKEIAQGNIDYNYYLSKEVYPFAYYGDNEIKNLQSLPKNFYDYRKNIDYNNDVLKDYFTYYSFLRYHFRNLALTEHLKHSKDTIYNSASLNYNLERLKLIDSLVTNEDIKNPLLSLSTMSFINSCKNESELDSVLNFYYAKNTDKVDEKHIKKLVKSLKQIKAGNPIPDVVLLNYNDNEISLKKLIKKPTVIHFWSKEYKSHFKESHAKIKELKAKYPEVNFIAINIDNPNTKSHAMLLKQYNHETSGEYQLKYPERAKQTLAINPIIKVMLVNKKGEIVDPHTNMFSIRFEEEILGLLNQ